MVTVLVVVLPIQSGTTPFWAGEFGPARLGQQKPSGVITPKHVPDTVMPVSVVVVNVSTGNVVVEVVAPRTVALTTMVVVVTVTNVVEVSVSVSVSVTGLVEVVVVVVETVLVGTVVTSMVQVFVFVIVFLTVTVFVTVLT